MRQLTAAEHERALRGRDRPADSAERVASAARGAVADARAMLWPPTCAIGSGRTGPRWDVCESYPTDYGDHGPRDMDETCENDPNHKHWRDHTLATCPSLSWAAWRSRHRPCNSLDLFRAKRERGQPW